MAQHDVAALQKRYPNAVPYSFGDSPEMNAELLQLVLDGTKTATCGALRDFEDGLEAMPELSRCDIVLGPDGAPAAVTRTTELRKLKFIDVDASFAYDEGEGDRTLETWRRFHQAYFERNGGFDPQMLLLCERFELVEAL